MGAIKATADQVYREFRVDGDEDSGNLPIRKETVRALFTLVDHTVEEVAADAALAVSTADDAKSIAETAMSLVTDGVELTLASEADATALVNTNKLMVAARVRTAIEKASFKFEDMQNAETLAAIINRTGRCPQMDGAQAGDSSHHAAINTTTDKVITGGGGIVWMPALPGADWKVGGPIALHKSGYATSYLTMQGVGDRVRLKRLNATGDIFTIGDGTNPVYYVTLKNIYLSAAVSRTSGSDIKLRKANVVELENIVMDGSFQGIDGQDLNSVYATKMHINMPNQTSGYGAIVRSEASGSGRSDIVVFTEVTVQAYNAGSYGLLVDGRVHGCHTNGFYALGTRRGLQLVSSAPSNNWGDIPSFGDYRKFETDRALDYSATLEKGYRNEFHRAELSNTSGAMDSPYPQGGNDDCAVYLGAGMTDTKFIGGRIGNANRQAVQDYSKGGQFIGTTFADMSKAGTNQSPAVFLGSTAGGFAYQACRVEGYGRASYAFDLHNAASNGIIHDNLYTGLVSGFSNGTGTNVSIENNIGF